MWEYVEDIHQLIERLQAQGVIVLAIEQADKAIALHEYTPSDQTHAVVFGNEVKGVQQSVVETADHCIEIPQFGTKHSLNISVSCGVVLWDLFNKLKH